MSDLSVLKVHALLRNFAERGHDIISNPGRISGFSRNNTHYGALIHHLHLAHEDDSRYHALTTFLGNESGAITEVSSYGDGPDLTDAKHRVNQLRPVLHSSGGWEREPSAYEYKGLNASADTMEQLSPHIHKIRSSGITPVFRDTKSSNDTPTHIQELQKQGFHMPTGLGEHSIETHGILTDTRDVISALEPQDFGGHLVMVGYTKGNVYSNYIYNLHNEKLHHVADYGGLL